MDSYYLNMGVRKLDEFLSSAKSPAFAGEIVYEPMGSHCWGPSMPELMEKMVQQMERRAPAGADLRSWRY